MPDGPSEAGMQPVYERKSNITLHRDLSGPTQRILLLLPPRLPPFPSEQGCGLLQLLSVVNSEPFVSLFTKNTIIEARKGMASYPHFINGETKVESQATDNVAPNSWLSHHALLVWSH